MKHTNLDYKGFTIQQRIDVKSHSAAIYRGGELIKMVAGDIAADGSNNAIDKAKGLIDRLYVMPERLPFFEQFSVEQMRNQYKGNAEGLRRMEAKAKATGKKVSGYTLSELTESAERYEFLSKHYTRD